MAKKQFISLYFFSFLVLSGLNSCTVDTGSNLAIDFDTDKLPINSNWHSFAPNFPLNAKDYLWVDGVAIAVGSEGSIFRSSDLIYWQPMKSPTEDDLLSVTWGNGRFIAVGEKGTILLSQNSIDWHHVKTDTKKTLRKVISSGEQFVAVGDDATLITSIFGDRWQTRKSNLYYDDIQSIAWNGSLYIAVASSSRMLFSEDGIDWQVRNNLFQAGFNDIIWAKNRFIIVGEKKSGIIITSEDGYQWEKVHETSARFLTRVAYSPKLNRLVAVGDDGAVLQSENGLLWQASTIPSFSEFHCVAWLNIQFVVGCSGYDYDEKVVFTSNNAETWQRAAPVNNNLNGIIWDGQQYVAVSNDGVIKKSPDGKVWSATTIPFDLRITELVWTNGKYVGTTNKRLVLVSEDARTWTQNSIGKHVWLSDIALIQNRFFIVGELGTIATSENAIDWKFTETKTSSRLFSLAFSGDTYIVVGNDGVILKSEDGNSWLLQESTTDAGLRKVVWDGQHFIAIGDRGTILSSANGVSWSRHQTDIDKILLDIVVNDGLYVVTGRNVVLTSDDRISWIAQDVTQFGNQTYSSIRWFDNQFLVLGSEKVFSSVDGEIWKEFVGPHPVQTLSYLLLSDGRYRVVNYEIDTANFSTWSPKFQIVENDFRAIAMSKNSFVIAGDGLILSSANTEDWIQANLDFGSHYSFNDVKWIGDQFVAMGSNGLIATSLDGQYWNQRGVDFTESIYEFIQFKDKIIAVGTDGSVITSSDLSTWQRDYIHDIGQEPGRGLDITTNGEVAVVVSFTGHHYTSLDGLHWQAQNLANTFPFGFRSIHWASGNFYANDAQNIIHITTDLSEWRKEQIGVTDIYDFEISSANNVLFALGSTQAAFNYRELK